MTQRRAPLLATAPFMIGIGLVCLGLAVSAIHSALTLGDLRDEYLRGRALTLATWIDGQTRGPERRHSPQVWQRVLERSLELQTECARYVVATDAAGRILAEAGSPSPDWLLVATPLVSRGAALEGLEPAAASLTVTVGIDRRSAAFIDRQALLHLAISALAILALVALALHLRRTLRRFLSLKAQEESQRQFAALGRMAATLAHEIRNPLGAMKGLVQVAQEEHREANLASELLGTVVGEAERLERLVNDLLSFARPPRCELEALELTKTVGDVVSLVKPKLDAAGVRLRLDMPSQPLTMTSDRDGLRQVLLNVLINAVQASPEGAEIVLTVRRGTQQVEISVDDQGPGLEGHDPEQLFQPFATQKLRGTGLGLAISRQIVERLGGHISLADTSGGGMRCQMNLPLRAPEREAA